jgi:GT2 family glycosyltransferase
MTDISRNGSSCGVVAIGRNEGERLRQCLQSVIGKVAGVVYVDSGSADGSVAMARSMGVLVVELDMSVPFTAARARNAGFARLLESFPDLDYVQFVDGDCEVVAGWLETASRFLCEHPDAAVACGRRRERYPQKTIYNALCDIEWDSPVGEVRACGGDAMMRASSFQTVDGFRTDMIAGEEPELCVRLRAAGGRIWRLGEEMTLHDAAMTRFGQWWQRSKRAGYAYALGAWLHGQPPELHYVRHARRAVLWGIALPALIVVSSLLEPRFIGLAALYPLKVLRIGLSDNRNAVPWRRAMFLVLGHFPEGFGFVKFYVNKAFDKKAFLIEYK